MRENTCPTHVTHSTQVITVGRIVIVIIIIIIIIITIIVPTRSLVEGDSNSDGACICTAALHGTQHTPNP